MAVVSIDGVYVAQYALKEAFEHARTVERLLYSLQSEIRSADEAIDRLKAKIRIQVNEGRQADTFVAEGRRRHLEQIDEIHKRISYLREETETDRSEKIRLLRIIDMYVNGSPTPTLADWSFYHNVNSVRTLHSRISLPTASMETVIGMGKSTASDAAVSFSKTMSGLPQSNSWLLGHQHFFQFASALINLGVLQNRRGFRVDIESNIISAAVSSNVNVELVQTLSDLDAADLELL